MEQNPTLQDVKLAASTLKNTLTKEIERFYKDTGLEPDIQIMFTPLQGIGERRRAIVSVDVSVNIRS